MYQPGVQQKCRGPNVAELLDRDVMREAATYAQMEPILQKNGPGSLLPGEIGPGRAAGVTIADSGGQELSPFTPCPPPGRHPDTLHKGGETP